MLPKRKVKNSNAQPETTAKSSNLVNVVDKLQLQIEEERNRARKKIISPPGEPIAEYKTPLAKKTIQKKKKHDSIPQKNSNRIVELPPPSEEMPSERSTEMAKPKYADSVTESIETIPQSRKLKPTGFTYFDMLNERDIMDPMSDD